MTIFYVTLLLVHIFSLMARMASNKKTQRSSLLFVTIVSSILTIVSGLRNNIGDTSMYIYTYGLIGPDYNSNGDYEPGFVLFLKILKSISEDPQFMLLVTSIIVNVLIVYTLWRYSKYYYFEIATFLYVASGYYLVTMNGIRQCLAASIIFAATKLFIEKKTIPYILVIIFACTIHTSAFIMIPVYFIAQFKPWSKTTMLLVGLTIIGMVLYEPLMDIASNILGNNKLETYKSSTEGGANIIRIMIFFVPVVLAYLRKDIINKEWNKINIFVNISLLSSLVMLFSAIHWVFSRFTLYLQPYTFILLAYMIKNCFTGKERRLLYYGVVVCYTLFFFIECPSNLNNVPYSTDFNLNDFLYK